MPGFFDSYLAGKQARIAEQDQQVARQQQAEQYGQGQQQQQAASVGRYAQMFLSLPAEQKPMAYPRLVQLVNDLKMEHPPIPNEYSPTFDAGIEKFAQALNSRGGAAGGILSTYVDGEGNRVGVGRDGSTHVLGSADQGMSNQSITIKDGQGRDVQVTFNKRTGQYEMAGLNGQGGAPVPAAAPPAAAGQDRSAEYASAAEFMRQNGVPDAKIETWLGQQQGMVPAGVDPQASAPQVGQFVGPTPGQVEADKTAASERAKFSADQQRAGFDAQQAAAVETAKTQAGIAATNQANAAAALPQSIASGEDALKVINDLLKHPGRKTATGASSKLDPRNFIPGTDATDFRIKAGQLQGKAFLQAFESLKGGGQITEIEGKKATDAIAALDTAQSDEQYERALRDLRVVVMAGILRAKAKAGRPAAAASPSGFRVLD